MDKEVNDFFVTNAKSLNMPQDQLLSVTQWAAVEGAAMAEEQAVAAAGAPAVAQVEGNARFAGASEHSRVCQSVALHPACRVESEPCCRPRASRSGGCSIRSVSPSRPSNGQSPRVGFQFRRDRDVM